MRFCQIRDAAWHFAIRREEFVAQVASTCTPDREEPLRPVRTWRVTPWCFDRTQRPAARSCVCSMTAFMRFFRAWGPARVPGLAATSTGGVPGRSAVVHQVEIDMAGKSVVSTRAYRWPQPG